MKLTKRMLSYRDFFALVLFATFPVAVWARGGPGGAIAYGVLMLAQLINFLAIVIGLVSLKATPAVGTNSEKQSARKVVSPLFPLAIIALVALLSWLSTFGVALVLMLAALLLNGLGAYFAIRKAYNIRHATAESWWQLVLHIVGSFWLTCVTFSLLTVMSHDATGGFALPWLVGFEVANKFERFSRFLEVPIYWALISASALTLITAFFIPKNRQRLWLPFIFWISGVLAFFIAGNLHQDQLMSAELAHHKPKFLNVRSFTTSFFKYQTHGRSEHATFQEDGKTFYWSYAELRFLE